MRNKITQHERVYEILSDHEWHSNQELNFTYRLTHAAQRIGEMLSDKERWPAFDLEFGWDGEWRKYRLKRSEPVQGKLIPLTQYN
jgi:hypothetical protein